MIHQRQTETQTEKCPRSVYASLLLLPHLLPPLLLLSHLLLLCSSSSLRTCLRPPTHTHTRGEERKNGRRKDICYYMLWVVCILNAAQLHAMHCTSFRFVAVLIDVRQHVAEYNGPNANPRHRHRHRHLFKMSWNVPGRSRKLPGIFFEMSLICSGKFLEFSWTFPGNVLEISRKYKCFHQPCRRLGGLIRLRTPTGKSFRFGRACMLLYYDGHAVVNPLRGVPPEMRIKNAH